MAKKPKPNADDAKGNSLAVEIGRISKLFALYLLKNVDDEGDKIIQLNAVGFSASEIAALLDKTENNVCVRISTSKAKRSK